tara:strand:+ start:446 stop:1894 length:1449 start_codon:yes stop_codon:yes gene_type:complete
MELSKNQKVALEKFKKGNNLFITGPGGSGKTYLIHKMIEICSDNNKKYQVCALTGCAALLLNCNAKTIHSWSGIKIAKEENDVIIDRLYGNFFVRKAWRSIKVLIIDEVSMMSKKIFDLLYELGKVLRHNEKPFGNIQVVFIGDFYQLPPIMKEGNDTGGEGFCFESENWFKTFKIENHINLDYIFRQSDDEYKKILNKMRVGEVDEEMIEKLKDRVCESKKIEKEIVKIYAIKKKVESVNESSFQKLEEKEYTNYFKIDKKCDIDVKSGKKIPDNIMYSMKKMSEKHIEFEINNLINNLPCEKLFKIKKGCRVMSIVNLDLDIGISNGSQGTVVDVILDKDDKLRLVKIEFDNGVVKEVGPYSWQSEEVPMIVISQFPIILSWAITIHKIQGVTLDAAEADIGNSIFEYGQSYVACSRIKTLDGLYLTGFNYEKIKANPKVKDFYKSFESQEFETVFDGIINTFDKEKKKEKDENVKIIKL